MARKVNQVLWDQWRQRIERQRASGLSVVEFCREEGVSQAAFHRWKRKLARPHWSVVSRRVGGSDEALAEAPQSATPRAEGSGGRPQCRRAKRTFCDLPVRGMRSSPWIELTLVDGTVVRVPQENLAALVTLLRVLRGTIGCAGRRGAACLASLRRSAFSCMRCRRTCEKASMVCARSSARRLGRMFWRAITSFRQSTVAIDARFCSGTAMGWWFGRSVWNAGASRCLQASDAASLAIEVDCVTLAMMIGGVDLKTAKRRKRYQAAAR